MEITTAKNQGVQIMVAVILLVVSLCEIITIPIFDWLLMRTNANNLPVSLLCVGIFIAFYTVIEFFAEYSQSKMLANIKKNTQSGFINRYTKADPQECSNIQIGEFLKLHSAVDSVGERTLTITKIMAESAKIIVASVFVVVTISWKLLFAIVIITASLSLLKLVAAPLQNRISAALNADAQGGSFAKSIAANMRIIKQSMCQEGVSQKYDQILDEFASIEMKKERLLTVITVLQQGSRAIVLLIIPMIVGLLMANDNVQPQALVTADIAFLVISGYISNLVGQIGELQQHSALTNMANRILEASLWKEIKEIQKNPSEGWKLSGVSFAYGDDPVFSNIEIAFPAQGVICISGENGTGKSTLLDIMSGLKQESTGTIMCGENACDRNTRLSLTAYQPQQSYLFSGTIRENIEYAVAQNAEDMDAYFSELGLDSAIKKLPQGLDTVVEAGGENLSMGQRQLVCFLRAIYKQASLIILDEPISSMNEQTASEVVSAVRLIAKKALIIVVSHQNVSKQLDANVVSISDL